MSKTNLSLCELAIKSMYSSEVISVACPSEVEGIKISYNEDGRLLIVLSQHLLIFLFPDGSGKKRNVISNYLSKINSQAIVVLVKESNELTIIDKYGTAKQIDLKDLKSTWIEREYLSENPRNMSTTLLAHEVSRNKNDTQNIPWTLLDSPNPNNFHLLSAYVNELTKQLSKNGGQIRPEVWSRITDAALTILPQAIEDRSLFPYVVTVLARSSIFLSETQKAELCKKLIEVAIQDRVSLEVSENLSSIVLGLLPYLQDEDLRRIVMSILHKLPKNKTIAPSLAQFFSTANLKLNKR